MKRFVIFSGSNYYPDGGWNDFRKACDTLEEGKAFLLAVGFEDWAHIVDITQNKIVWHTKH